MKFPTFPDLRMVGLSACARLQSPTGDIREFLHDVQKRRPLASYRARKETVRVHILGGGSASDHLHVDIFKKRLLDVDRIRAPKDDTSRQAVSDELDRFVGAAARVTYTGLFLVASSEITGGGLIHPLRFGGRGESEPHVEMTSASFAMVGFGVRKLSWKLVPDDRFRVELSYSRETTIDEDYLVSASDQLSEQFDFFATGKKRHGSGE